MSCVVAIRRPAVCNWAMESVPGYHGGYLRVDLTDRTSRRIEWPEGVLRRFIGGAGLGAWVLGHETSGVIDPLRLIRPWCLSSAHWSEVH